MRAKWLPTIVQGLALADLQHGGCVHCERCHGTDLGKLKEKTRGTA